MYKIIKTARVSTSFLKGFHFKIVRRNSEMLIFIKNLKKKEFLREKTMWRIFQKSLK